jgi:hypothetical protein
MVAAVRVPKTQRARREVLKHAPKIVSLLSAPHPTHVLFCLSKTSVRLA